MIDNEFSDEEKSVRRIEEAGLIRTPHATRRLANERLRVAICELTDANMGNMQAWLNEIAWEDPAKGIDFLLRMLEFAVPKLSRVEAQITTDAGASALGDLTVRDLQEMVLEHRRAESIDGECKNLDEFAHLI